MTADTSVLDQLLERVEQMFELPKAVTFALKLCQLDPENSTDFDFSGLAKIINNDAELHQKFSQASSIPALRLATDFTTDVVATSGSDVDELRAFITPELLAELGLSTIQGMLLGFCLPKMLVDDEHPDFIKTYWQQSLTQAIAARLCFKKNRCGEIDDAFASAMVLDIGAVALLRELAGTYVEFVTEARQLGYDLLQLESESLGFDHRILSSRLVERWGLPKSIVDAVGMMHLHVESQLEVDPPRLVQLLSVGDCAAKLLVLGDSLSATAVLQQCEKYFGWDDTDVRLWLDEIIEPAKSFAACLPVEFGPFADYRTLLNEAELRRIEAKRQSAEEAKSKPILKDLAKSVVAPTTKKNRQAAGQNSTANVRIEDSNCGIDGIDVDDLSAPIANQVESQTEQGLAALEASVNQWEGEETKPSTPFDNLFGNSGKPGLIDAHGRGACENWSEDPGVLGRVSDAIRNGRMQRKPLSLILIQIDDFPTFLFSESVDDVYQVQQGVLTALKRLSAYDLGEVFEVSDERFMLILPALERTESNRIAQSIQQLIRTWSHTRSQKNKSVVSLSIGCASAPVPSKNFEAKSLVEAAQRCLEAVQLGSGNDLKSIEIF